MIFPPSPQRDASDHLAVVIYSDLSGYWVALVAAVLSETLFCASWGLMPEGAE
jgi:hypothetical protein